MYNKYHIHSTTQVFNTFTKFIHHFSKTKNHEALKRLHAHLITTSVLHKHQKLQTKLIRAYATCHQNSDFDLLPKFLNGMNIINPTSFNVLISDFCRTGFPLLALNTFYFMHKNGVSLDTYALCSALKAAIIIENVEFGKLLHTHMVKSGWSCSVFLGSALIDLYAKSWLLKDAVVVFDEIPVKNTVCANALLSGFCEAKLCVEGLELVREMQLLRLEYDHFTLSAMLRVCAGLCSIELGKQVHANLIRVVKYVKTDVFLQSSLIEMYGKCGQVAKACQIFSLAGFEPDASSQKDVVLWTSMLGVYGKNGHFKEVIKLYEDMLTKGTRPDKIAFVTVLSACVHTGEVKLGIECFKSMARDFGLEAQPEHYSCVVDLLCRTDELDMAWMFVNKMPDKMLSKCNISMWGALLNAYMDRGNVELGKLAAERALKMDPRNAGVYVLLSNLYARLGMWDEIEQLRVLIKEKELDKDVGFSRNI